jgi:HD-like signal output (HDOD) protein
MSANAPEQSLNLLLVDGDRSALDEMCRMLGGARKPWNVVGFEKPAEALAELESSSFDVVVAALWLPDMCGTDFLLRVQQAVPRAARILVCAKADSGVLRRGLPVAHFILTRHFDADCFFEAIERGSSVQRLLQNERVISVVSRIDALPVGPKIHAQIRAALQSPDYTVEQLAGIVERDPPLCGRLLRLVNSGLFGFSARVTSIRAAITFAGATMLEHLALVSEVSNMLQASPAPKGFSLDAEIDRSLRVGRAAACIVDRVNRDEAFVAGLMHDVGRLVMACRLPDLFVRSCEHAHRKGVSIQEAERAVAGSSHAEIGAYLAGLWGLPSTVVEAIGFHHSPGEAAARSFGVLGAVHTATALVSGESDASNHELDEGFLRQLGLIDKLDQLRQEVDRVVTTAN